MLSSPVGSAAPFLTSRLAYMGLEGISSTIIHEHTPLHVSPWLFWVSSLNTAILTHDASAYKGNESLEYLTRL